ncbi:MAG: GNAT family N-acetyltransferase [Mycobacteriales bacterium]
MTSRRHPLDNPALFSLAGAHAGLAERRGRAAVYPPDVSPFAGIPAAPVARDWADLAALVGPDRRALLVGAPQPPDGWRVLGGLPGVQLVDDGAAGAADPEAVRLGPADVPEMLELVAATRPGPFRERTVEMGTYLGIRRGGALIAMAGQRLQPAGWVEISAVCADPAWRGQGLASRLIRAIIADIRDRGGRPMLHTGTDNDGALRLYTRQRSTLPCQRSIRRVIR